MRRPERSVMMRNWLSPGYGWAKAGPCGGKDVACIGRAYQDPLSLRAGLSVLSGRKLRQNHGARLGSRAACAASAACCHQPRARAAKVSLLPSRYAFSELDRIIDTCRAGWSLQEVWNNEIMTTLARSDRHWMNHANFLLILSLNLSFRLQVYVASLVRQLVRWPVSRPRPPETQTNRFGDIYTSPLDWALDSLGFIPGHMLTDDNS